MPYHHLTIEERSVIAHLIRQGKSRNQIAVQLSRSSGTISRELSRNCSARCGSIYHANAAQRQHDQRRHAANGQRGKLRHKPLQQAIKKGLKQRWSPKIISENIKRKHRNDSSMHVSSPTIYAYLKRDAKQGGKLQTQLPRCGKGRKPNGSRTSRRQALPGRRSITQRPNGADNRSRRGHWEGDTVEGSHKKSFIVSMVDRKSRYTLLAKTRDKSVATINATIIRMFDPLPASLRRTATLDNGTEFAGFKQLEKLINIQIYFADPYSPWQRGTNEQTNGLLRMFLPKGTNFRHVSDTRLAQIEAMLNNRPRKCLNYRTPAEVFKPPPGVALRI